MRDIVKERYFDWLKNYIWNDKYPETLAYDKLLHKLYETTFYYSIDRDYNRASDGKDLRYRFGREYGYSEYVIFSHLDKQPCSVLEMLIALAIRCDEQLMYDSDIGERVGDWFWAMINNLDLSWQNDSNYDEDYISFVLQRFLDRNYEIDGTGNIFRLSNPTRDLRKAEIWYQMCWYLDEMIERGL